MSALRATSVQYGALALALFVSACSSDDKSASGGPATAVNANQPSAGGSASTGAAGANSAGSGGSSAGSAGAPAAASAAGTGSVSPSMTFFVTSTGKGDGGNFGGLDGADAFCTSLAQKVSTALGAKTWHAYLSTSTVNARDRIGTGPWTNAAGVVIGTSVDQLHDQAAGGASESTYPLNSPDSALDEQGNPVPLQPVLHDILTGSNLDGTVSASGTCSDWTSNTGTTRNGHANRAGGGQNPSSWNSAHDTGCGEPTAGMNFQMGTVSQGGGRGSIYCFAID